MNIIILSAMTEEVSYLVDNFDVEKIDEINGQQLYRYISGNTNLYILNSGIGKVESSITTSIFLSKYKVDKLISIGTSGALTGSTRIGDFVNGNALAYHDVDVTAFGYEIGTLPNQQKYFTPTQDKWWFNIIERFKNIDNIKVHDGSIVTGDQFIASSNKKQFINKHFETALACEMESTAIAHTSLSYGIDTYVLRSISDLADGEADVTFDEYLLSVCKNYKKFVEIILENE